VNRRDKHIHQSVGGNRAVWLKASLVIISVGNVLRHVDAPCPFRSCASVTRDDGEKSEERLWKRVSRVFIELRAVVRRVEGRRDERT